MKRDKFLASRKFLATDQERKQDPFVDAGFGVIAFFKTLRTLIVTFSLFTIFLALPQMLIYAYFNGGDSFGTFSKDMTMLANTGVSSV
jgi:hypothetical protein